MGDELQPAQAHCQRHPDRPANVRCGRCDAPVCPECMVQAPVGFRCPDCGRGRRLPTEQTEPNDLYKAIAFCLVFSTVGGFGAFVAYVAYPSFILHLLLAVVIGIVSAEGTSFFANRKRSPLVAIVAAVGAASTQISLFVFTALIPLLADAPWQIAFFQPFLQFVMGAPLAFVVAFLRLRR